MGAFYRCEELTHEAPSFDLEALGVMRLVSTQKIGLKNT
jgi:hypothetical protein